MSDLRCTCRPSAARPLLPPLPLVRHPVPPPAPHPALPLPRPYPNTADTPRPPVPSPQPSGHLHTLPAVLANSRGKYERVFLLIWLFVSGLFCSFFPTHASALTVPNGPNSLPSCLPGCFSLSHFKALQRRDCYIICIFIIDTPLAYFYHTSGIVTMAESAGLSDSTGIVNTVF